MSFAREGLIYIAIAATVSAALFAWASLSRSWALWLVAFAVLLVAIWVAYFFRDPERTGERGERLVVAPADGRIVQIAPVNEPSFVEGPSTRISIFMNVFNVHVNRYPVTGVVRYVHYNPGKFINAAHDKASLDNEQRSVGIVTASGEHVLVRQIAGLVARRIITRAEVGDTAIQGERMGMIKFGSRVDVFVPPSSSLRVKVGEITASGVTVLAELPR